MNLNVPIRNVLINVPTIFINLCLTKYVMRSTFSGKLTLQILRLCFLLCFIRPQLEKYPVTKRVIIIFNYPNHVAK